MKINHFILVLGAVLSLAAFCDVARADASNDCSNLLQGKPIAGTTLVISSDHLPPSTTTNLRLVTVCRMNIFRYNMAPVAQTTISNPPAPPAGLFSAASGGSGSTGSQLPANSPTTSTHVNQLAQTVSGANLTPEQEVAQFQQRVTDSEMAASAATEKFTKQQTDASGKVACYNLLANEYPAVLLTVVQQTALENALDPSKNDKACSKTVVALWGDTDLDHIQGEIQAVLQLDNDLSVFETTDDYQTYLGDKKANSDALKAVFAAFFTTNADTITTLQGLMNPTNIATYNASVRTGQEWDARAAAALAPGDPWDQTLRLTCRLQWFGKTQSDTVTLPYTDYAQATPAPASSPAFSFTNACLASLTVSTGLGISTVRNSTYGFEPQTNYAVTPPITTQVIGYATDARITPFYVGQMNYSYLHPERSIGLHVAGGAGVGSSSAGTTSDFFLGNAFSFFHRAIFVTPSAHFTQRQELMSGYAVGDAQGSLTSVPTINHWTTGFAVTITLPVLQ